MAVKTGHGKGRLPQGAQFKTIVAKYPGRCGRCGGPIVEGDTVRWGGRGRVYHYASECGQGDADASERDLRERMGDEPRTWEGHEMRADVKVLTEYIRDPGEDAADRWNEVF